MPGGGGGKGREGRGSGRLEKVLSILPLAAFWDPNKAGFVFLWGLKYSVTYRLRDRVLWCRRALQARRAASPGPSAWKQCCVFCGQHNIAQSYSPMDPKSYPVLLYPAPITFSDLSSWGLDGMPPMFFAGLEFVVRNQEIVAANQVVLWRQVVIWRSTMEYLGVKRLEVAEVSRQAELSEKRTSPNPIEVG